MSVDRSLQCPGTSGRRPARPTALHLVHATAIAVALALIAAFWMTGDASASHWTETPFPPGEFVRDVAQDSQGNIWASTLEESGTFGHIEVLWKGASGWEDACAGLSWDYSSWDDGLESVGDKVFLVTMLGECYARGPGDSQWHVVSADVGFFDLTAWDGYLWAGGVGQGVARLDPATEQAETFNDGLPMAGGGFDNTRSFWAPRGNNDYLYVGFRVPNDVAASPEFEGIGVYRLARGASTWEDTGLKVMVLGTDFRSDTGGTDTDWGVWNLSAMDGYVLAEMNAPAEALSSRLFLFDERAGAWSNVTLPSQKPSWYYDTSEADCYAWDRKFYFPAGFGAEGALFDEFDPASRAWRQNVTLTGISWQPLGDAARVVGNDLLIGGPSASGGDGTKGDGTTTNTEASFVESVPLPTQISKDPAVIGTNFGLAVLFALVFGFTSTLFNSTLRSNGGRMARTFSPLSRGAKTLGVKARPPLRRFANWLKAFTFRSATVRAISAHAPRVGRRWLERAALVVVAALIYAFLDPTFGFSGHGVNVFFSLLVSVTVVTAAYEGTQAFTSSRGFRIPAAVKLFPAAIMIAVICVLLSRLSGFTPGYLYGFVGGLAFLGAQHPDPRRHGWMVLVGATCLLAVSLAAWFLAMPVATAAEAGSGWAAVVQSICAAVFVAGLEGTLFGLIPLTFLDGGALFHWNKVAWASLFGAATFLFWHVLLNKNSKYGAAFEQKNTLVVLALLGFWTLITVSIYLLFRRRRPKTPAGPGPGQPYPGGWGQYPPGVWGQAPPPPPLPTPAPPPTPPAPPAQW